MAGLFGGGAAYDTIFGHGGEDFLFGDMANSEMATGNDRILGGPRNDHILGGPGADVMKGGPGGDEIGSSGGKDKMYGEDGLDSLGGGGTMHGGPHDDFLYSYGSAELYGDSGEDYLEAVPVENATGLTTIDAVDGANKRSAG